MLTAIDARPSSAVAPIMPIGPPSLSSPRGWRGGDSSASPQNTPDQILVIENSVSRPTARANPTAHHDDAAIPASTSANLARNPENGGMPARLSAGTANSSASTGAVRISPPTSLRRLDPARRSTRPATRNRAVFTMMWCTM